METKFITIHGDEWKLYKSEDLEHGQGYYNHENDNWVCTECHDQFLSTP